MFAESRVEACCLNAAAVAILAEGGMDFAVVWDRVVLPVVVLLRERFEMARRLLLVDHGLDRSHRGPAQVQAAGVDIVGLQGYFEGPCGPE